MNRRGEYHQQNMSLSVRITTIQGMIQQNIVPAAHRKQMGVASGAYAVAIQRVQNIEI